MATPSLEWLSFLHTQGWSGYSVVHPSDQGQKNSSSDSSKYNRDAPLYRTWLSCDTWKDYVKGNFFITKTKSKTELKNTTKTLRDRVVPVHPIVQEALKMQPRQLHDDHIVISRHKRGYASYEPLTKSFNLAMTKLQIRYRSPYNARHTCATMMLESGMEPAYCAHVLGHSLEEFLRTYARWIDADRSAAQAKIWATIK